MFVSYLQWHLSVLEDRLFTPGAFPCEGGVGGGGAEEV